MDNSDTWVLWLTVFAISRVVLFSGIKLFCGAVALPTSGNLPTSLASLRFTCPESEGMIKCQLLHLFCRGHSELLSLPWA